jgi:hypothetical protein
VNLEVVYDGGIYNISKEYFNMEYSFTGFGILTLSDTNIFDTNGGGTITTENDEVVIKTTGIGHQYILSKNPYRLGFTVFCDIKTNGADAAIFLVPKKTYDDKEGLTGLNVSDGIRYGPGDNRNAGNVGIKMFGSSEDVVDTGVSNEYHTYKLQYRGSTNTIKYAMDENGFTSKSFEDPPLTEYFYVGVFVYSDNTEGSFKNFKVLES